MKYNNLKKAYKLGLRKCSESIYYRLIIWPMVQKRLRDALIKAYKTEKIKLNS